MRFPWKWRYGLTSVCAALMLVNAVMTMLAFDCWYQREAGMEPVNAMEQFFENITATISWPIASRA